MTELDLYRKILNNPLYQVGDKAESPIPPKFRGKKDKSPSFSTFFGRCGKKIFWKDWGFNAPTFKHGKKDRLGNTHFRTHKADITALIALSTSKADTISEIDINAIKANIEDFDVDYIPLTIQDKIAIAKYPLEYDLMPLSAPHFVYIDRLGINMRILHRFKVSGLNAIYSGPTDIYNAEDHNLGFYWKVGNGDKGYIPFNGYYKNDIWVPNKFYHQNMDALEGYDFLPPTGDVLIFTKSMKDIWLLTFLGYNAISCSSETSLGLLTHEMCLDLVKRFKTIVVWGDPDPAGIIYSQKVSSKLVKAGGKDIRVAESKWAKDPTDITILTQDHNKVHQIIRKALPI